MIKKKKRSNDDNGFASWGGYMEAKKSKLLEQFKEESVKETASSKGIFQGISIYVNGYTIPHADELKRIMAVYGGEYHQYESHRTTHIIASNLPDCKIKKLKVLNVVKPEWIMDSVKAGKLLDYRKYLLYSKQSKSQPALNFMCKQDTPTELPDSSNRGKKAGTTESTVKQTESFPSQNVQDMFCSSNSQSPPDYNNGCNEQLKAHDANRICNVTSENIQSDCPVSEEQDVCMPDTRKITRTAVDTEFLSEFYSNSRLHHISTMGALFKQYICKLREQSNKSYEGRIQLKRIKNNSSKSLAYSLQVKENIFPEEVNDDDDDDDEFFAKETSAPHNSMRYKKIIMHIDMDCFFVSVGVRNRPELRGHPVAVTHAKGNLKAAPHNAASRKFEFNYYKERKEQKLKQGKNRNESETKLEAKKESDESESGEAMWCDDIGEKDSMSEIASCNYEARKAGVCNGMFLGSALKLCPNLKTIPYDFEDYKEVSYALYNTIARYTLDIEAVSCDEMYVDCTDILNETNTTPTEFAEIIRKEIKEKTGCPASAGFGSNPLLARLATRKAKPDGQYYLEPSHVSEFIQNIKVDDLPGVGSSLTHRLHKMGIKTCGDLQAKPLTVLKSEFGNKSGETLYKHCRGIDDRQLDTEHKRKSVSAEVNYGIRFTTQDEAEKFMKQLSNEVSQRLRSTGMRGRCITLKLLVRAKEAPVETAKFMGHGVCDHLTRSSSISFAVDESDMISREVINIFRQLEVNPSDLRGVGIQISRLQKSSGTKSIEISKFLAPKASSNMSMENVDSKAQIATCSNKPSTIVKNMEATNVKGKTADPVCFKKSEKQISAKHSNTVKIDKLFQGNSGLSISENKSHIRNGAETDQNISKVLCDLDKDTLSELPEDIQQEILMYSKEVKFKKKEHIECGSNSSCTESIDSSQIDPSFLSALPENVRKEVEEDLKWLKDQKRNPKEIKNLNTKLNASKKSSGKISPLPTCSKSCESSKMSIDKSKDSLRPDVTQELKQTKTQIVENHLQETKSEVFDADMNINEMRALLREWVATETEPKNTDIKMLCDFLCQMVEKKEIQYVDLVFKCLHRCISRKRSCLWQKVYHKILNEVQKIIIKTYKVKLKLPKHFLCEDECMKKSP